jgi:hypothetical protein
MTNDKGESYSYNNKTGRMEGVGPELQKLNNILHTYMLGQDMFDLIKTRYGYYYKIVYRNLSKNKPGVIY